MLTVDSYFELLALNRALMEVRFLGGDVDDAVRGSSYLADIHVRLVEEITAYHRDRGETGRVDSWHGWRVFSGRTLERQSIIEYVSRFWESLDSEELKRERLEALMKPFIYRQEDVDSLYQEIGRDLIQD
jgi:hypothetical protein